MQSKKFVKAIILIVLANCSSAFLNSYSEDIKIITYYPSPYGIYKQLRLEATDTVDPLFGCSNKGELYYDDSDSRFYVCDGISWLSNESQWTRNLTDVFPNDISWDVGIGTNTPAEKLHVTGNMQVDGNIDITGKGFGFDLDCVVNKGDETTTTDNIMTSINCPEDYIMTGGGGYCWCTGGVGISRLWRSYPNADGTGWVVGCKMEPATGCSEHTCTIYVRCCKVD